MNIDPVSSELVDKDGATLALVHLLNQLQRMGLTVWASGVSVTRPVDPIVGQLFYDTTLAALIVCTVPRAGATPAVWVPVSTTYTLPLAVLTDSLTERSESLTPASNAGVALNWNIGGSLITVNGTNAITFTNVAAAPAMATHTVYVSAFNGVTWPAAVTWGLGGIPSIAGAAWISLVSRNGGTNVEAGVVWRAN